MDLGVHQAFGPITQTYSPIPVPQQLFDFRFLQLPFLDAAQLSIFFLKVHEITTHKTDSNLFENLQDRACFSYQRD
jgi:hypothetical protein